MRYSLVSAALVATTHGHGLITAIQGANGVTMPGLSVADGTPRDCSSNGCGSQADTSIIRNRDIASGKASALGRTQGNGPVDAAAMIQNFMNGAGSAAVATNKGASGATGQEDELKDLDQATAVKKTTERKRQIADLFKGLPGGGILGGGGAGGGGAGGGLLGGGLGGGLGGLLGGGANPSATGSPGANAKGKGGLLGGGGGTKNDFAAESIVSETAGEGATKGLPTSDDNGEVSLVFRQINQDGAGPMTADIDATSGGTDAQAFQKAEITQDVPGLGIQGLSLATNTDFPMKVQMPAGMTCDGSVGGAQNVCIVRVRNGAAAGPFGGSAAFTQSNAARKRAFAYRLKKRMEIGRE